MMEATNDDAPQLLQVLLVTVRDQLQQEDYQGLTESTSALMDSAHKPNDVMKALSRFLFRRRPADSNRDAENHHGEAQPQQQAPTHQHDIVLSSQEALSVLGYLVTTHPQLYLRPAAQHIKLCAQRISRTLDQEMDVSPELLAVLVDQISRPDVLAASDATSALVACSDKLGPTFASQQVVPAVMESWKLALGRLASRDDHQRASTMAVRCADAMVQLMILHDATCRVALHDHEAGTLLLTMLTDASDPLLQLSSLDLLERLVTTSPMAGAERRQWCLSVPVVEPLLHLAGGSIDTEPDPMLGGNALRILAALGKMTDNDAAASSSSHRLLQDGFYHALHKFGNGELDRLALVDAISSYAVTDLDRVLDDAMLCEQWLSLHVAQPRLKAVVLQSVAQTLHPHVVTHGVNGNDDDDLPRPAPAPASAMRLFQMLGSINHNHSTTGLLLALVRAPLPEIRLATYATLQAIVQSVPSQGGQVLLSHPDFMDWLLHRELETTKEGREAKHELVRLLLHSPVSGLLTDAVVKKLELYVQQGAHYHKGLSWELATD